MTSGDPRKQPRPDGADPVEQMTEAFPPVLSCVATTVGAVVVPFPFIGEKAVDLQIGSGKLTMHVHIHPDVVDAVCEELQAAKANAQSRVQVADLSAMKREALAHEVQNGNGG